MDTKEREVTLTDRAFARLLGQELRRAREERGWSRAELLKHLPSDISQTTLTSYEQGARRMTVERFVEITRALGAGAPDILGAALERAGDLCGLQLHLNLRKLAKDEREGFEPVQRWAENRLILYSTPLVLLNPHAVRELSVAFGLTHIALAAYLIEFHPADQPSC